MANILEKIDVKHGKQLWHDINSCQQLVDFHRNGYVAKYTWDDLYDVVAYERSEGLENFISAMMAVNLVKGKIRHSYLSSADVFVGSITERLQDVYNDLFLMFCRRIPTWDMSYGVYLDTYLAKDINRCIKNTADFSVYGTGMGTDGPGVATSLSIVRDKTALSDTLKANDSAGKNDAGFAADASLQTNLFGEIFELAEQSADADMNIASLAKAFTSGVSDSFIHAIAFAHSFRHQMSHDEQRLATSSMKDYLLQSATAEQTL